ncbi:hypothetical protein Krad_2269 [Kineococcus radiotolerans SRS30216 = ATCC BAA-149]|uniref:Lipoprotein n=1 Tax=Kineococcus radiotolerans (strain ATCC BAA-149 / DSM 14245 / SRS30216) TaxID=266940 RepID=A6WAB1_KINRD|nr:hypothetical protein Krad_2269 [Kineococcus radiotolerans SRS30216 = ATCC BAA-149]
MRSGCLALMAAVGLWAASGCSDDAPAPTASSAPTSTSPAATTPEQSATVETPASEGAPAAFRERFALPQCAPITVDQGRVDPAALQDCLLSSDAQREGAEVLVTSNTVEGDPIKTYYRALPGEGLEVFTDATADSFGSEGWRHVRCVDVAAAVENLDSCQEA